MLSIRAPGNYETEPLFLNNDEFSSFIGYHYITDNMDIEDIIDVKAKIKVINDNLAFPHDNLTSIYRGYTRDRLITEQERQQDILKTLYARILFQSLPYQVSHDTHYSCLLCSILSVMSHIYGLVGLTLIPVR